MENPGHSGDVTIIFEPASGGRVEVERAPITSILMQIVTNVLQQLGVQQPRNITVTREGSVLDLNSTLETLGLRNGTRLVLAWQVGGGHR